MPSIRVRVAHSSSHLALIVTEKNRHQFTAAEKALAHRKEENKASKRATKE